jgi:hypothetical protein
MVVGSIGLYVSLSWWVRSSSLARLSPATKAAPGFNTRRTSANRRSWSSALGTWWSMVKLAAPVNRRSGKSSAASPRTIRACGWVATGRSGTKPAPHRSRSPSARRQLDIAALVQSRPASTTELMRASNGHRRLSRHRAKREQLIGALLPPWRTRLLSHARPPPPCHAAPFAVAVVGRLVWRQLHPAVGAVARDGHGPVVRWPPPPCGAAPFAVAVVGRLVWRKLHPAVGAVARDGRVLVLVLHSHVSISCQWLRVETNESAGYRQVMAISTP